MTTWRTRIESPSCTGSFIGSTGRPVQQNQARAYGDDQALQAVELLRTAFLIGHLGRWLGPFILAGHDNAQCEFYRELAEFTELFVRLEGQRQDTAMRH